MKINTIQIYIYYASYFFYLTTKMGEREAEQKYTSTTYQYNNFLSDALLRMEESVFSVCHISKRILHISVLWLPYLYRK